MKNLFYFHHLNTIGGIEQFFAYLAEKYCDWDITIVYRSGDPKQVARLRKYVRVMKFSGQTFICDKAFFCFNIDIKDFVEAKEYNLILHGDYKTMVEQGQIDGNSYIFEAEFDNYYGVSQQVCDAWTELTGKKCTLVYNPIIQRPPKSILKLVYCGRLTEEKGGDLVQVLLDRLQERGIDYQLFVYSNQQPFESNNVIYLDTRLNAGQFLNKENYDYLLVLSKNEGYCYSLVQALCNGLPCIVTPCPVFKEIGVNAKNSIRLEFDASNIDEVIDKALLKNLNFSYTPKSDNWDKLLAPGKSDYELRLTTVQAIQRYYDMIEKIDVYTGDVYDTTEERAKLLVSEGFAVYSKEDK